MAHLEGAGEPGFMYRHQQDGLGSSSSKSYSNAIDVKPFARFGGSKLERRQQQHLAAEASHGNKHGSQKQRAAMAITALRLAAASKRPRRVDPAGGSKGLRQFATRVCEKLREKGVTTYAEVADELVREYAAIHPHATARGDDQKTIRRRVYDALNVLIAMRIIRKKKKEIRFIGMPETDDEEMQQLAAEKDRHLDAIRERTRQIHELIQQHVALKTLIKRNRDVDLEQQQKQQPSQPGTSSSISIASAPPVEQRVALPFTLLATDRSTIVDCSISADKQEYSFNLDRPFELLSEFHVLKSLGMTLGLDRGSCTEADLQQALTIVPKSLHSYVYDMAKGRNATITIPANLRLAVPKDESAEDDDEIFSEDEDTQSTYFSATSDAQNVSAMRHGRRMGRGGRYSEKALANGSGIPGTSRKFEEADSETHSSIRSARFFAAAASKHAQDDEDDGEMDDDYDDDDDDAD